jgi:hypothetical protein
MKGGVYMFKDDEDDVRPQNKSDYDEPIPLIPLVSPLQPMPVIPLQFPGNNNDDIRAE